MAQFGLGSHREEGTCLVLGFMFVRFARARKANDNGRRSELHPSIGDDRYWYLMKRGDSGAMGKKFALAYDEDLTSAASHDGAEISTVTLDSSIAVDQVMKHLASKTPLEREQLHK